MDVLVALLVLGMTLVIAVMAYGSYRRHARRARATSAAAHARLAMELHLAEIELNRRRAAASQDPDSGVEIGELPQEPHP